MNILLPGTKFGDFWNSIELFRVLTSIFWFSVDCLCLYGHPITLVELTGTITALDAFVDRYSLDLDDSTGVMRCNQWIDTPLLSAHGDNMNLNVLVRNQLRVGDLVRLRGKIRFPPNRAFGSRVELSIHGIQKEEDLNAEMLHWLEVMTLDAVYRKPFIPPVTIMKLTGRDRNTLEDAIRSYLGLSGPRNFRELKLTPKIGTPRNYLPAFVPPFSASTLLENETIWDAASILAHQKGMRRDVLVNEVIEKLVSSGDVLEDPDSKFTNDCRGTAFEKNVQDIFVTNSALSYSEQGKASEERPYILLTSELLAPVVYKVFLEEYELKLENRPGELVLYGAELYKIVEATRLLGAQFKRIAKHRISQAMALLVDLNLVYETEVDEFRPVAPIFAKEVENK